MAGLQMTNSGKAPLKFAPLASLITQI